MLMEGTVLQCPPRLRSEPGGAACGPGPITVRLVCGRFTSVTPPDVLARLFEADDVSGTEFAPNYNVAPTTRILAVAVSPTDSRRRLGRFHWGLVPHWAKDRSGASKLINARAETVYEKPSFRNLVPNRRCLVPVDGYYEWRTVGRVEGKAAGPKEPVYVTRADRSVMALAGLWTTWRESPDAPALTSCCLVTTAANVDLAPIHDRMPVVVEPEDWATWLAGSDTPREEVESMLAPAAPGLLSIVEVATTVNSIRNNGPTLVVPVDRPRMT